ncbi:MAG: DMT family transporter [Bacteroidales bacterium]|nr:DMT family transporter [Bacteroidales bacterium]
MSNSFKEHLPAHLAVIAANIIFGLNFVIAKGIMPNWLEPRAVIFLRVVGAGLTFWIVSFFMEKEKIAVSDRWRLLVGGIFGVAINQIMFFEGLNLTTPINASIIMVAVPILVLIMSHFMIGDKITWIKTMGITLGFSGAAFLILQSGKLSLGSETFLGNIFVLINAASYGFYLVLIKPLMARYHPVTVMKWVFTYGLLFVFPASINKIVHSDFTVIPFTIWLSIGFVIFFTTVLAYFFNNYSLKKISPSATSSYIYAQPFIAAVFAMIVGADKPNLNELIAAVLIFVGVYLVNKPKKKSVNLFSKIEESSD